jgi:hypothetical protein
MVPSSMEVRVSPVRVKACNASTRATSVPVIGVHSPGIRRIPQSPRNAQLIVVITGGSLHSAAPAPETSAEPATRRMSSKPVPGRPPANVEYKRRNRVSLVPTRMPDC